MTPFQSEVLETIREALMLADVPASFTPETDLFATFGLDSVDALEIVMALKRRYGVQFTAEDEKNKQIFQNLAALAAYVESRTAGA